MRATGEGDVKRFADDLSSVHAASSNFARARLRKDGRVRGAFKRPAPFGESAGK